MDANTVSGVLLELNVINTPELDAQINKMAAQIVDDRAARWFRRVVRYFVINLDALRDNPMKVPAEERGHSASNYYVDPKNPTADSPMPEAGHENEKGWKAVYDLANSIAHTKIRGSTLNAEDKEKLDSEREEAIRWIEDQLEARPAADSGWGRLRTEPLAYRFFNDLVAKAAQKLKADGRDVEDGWTSTSGEERKDQENWRDLETDTRRERTKRQIQRNESVDACVNRLLEADYETMLHQPLVQRDIENNYSQFKPSKAKAKRLPGEPVTKSELPDWMKGGGAKGKDLYHFDPIQVRKRALWNDLHSIVLYLNWQASNLKLANSAEKEEAAKGRTAEMLFRRLATMKTEDREGFRDVLKQAKDFRHAAEKEPWRFNNEGKVISKIGPLELRRVANPEMVMALTRRESGDSTLPYPKWCVKDRSYAESYAKSGPYYFVDKNEKPYILVHFGTGQARGLDNFDISTETAAQIAPLFDRIKVNTTPSSGYTAGESGISELRRLVDDRHR